MNAQQNQLAHRVVLQCVRKKGRTGQIIASKLQSQESEDEVAARRQDHVIANAYQDG